MHVLTLPSSVDDKNAVERIAPAVASGAPRRHASWLALLLLASATQAAQVVINGPAGSGSFGRTVTTLPNGNIIVTDPGFDAPGPVTDVGAVYLYRPDGTLISTLRGSRVNDRVGDGGVVVLTTGNFVVSSPNWDNRAIPDVGAVTFGSGTSGVAGNVSPANSLVGGQTGDFLESGVTQLTNGNFVVRIPSWDNGATADAGAVAFSSGMSAITGLVSPANSLVGSTANDVVGGFVDGIAGVTALTTGNYVVRSVLWDNGAIVDAGAATLGSGTIGVVGLISPTNSLVGTREGDFVGGGGVTALTNGNYVVSSPRWGNSVGAATFGIGTFGITGALSPANSLVGSTVEDFVGSVTALANGNYVVHSWNWDNGAIPGAGAVTFGSGTLGISGVVSPANSLVGSHADDFVGWGGVTALANGNYVVSSPSWNNGPIANVGAVTFSSGTNGITGVVSPANSLIGSTVQDRVGDVQVPSGVTALPNGNYVVRSPFWNNGGLVDAGAVTFGSGVSGVSGTVSGENSLVGGRMFDEVGAYCVSVLTNGNYVVCSANWSNGGFPNSGAVTLGSGLSGISGLVSPSNSLVGGVPFEFVGEFGVTALTNGNYVVSSPRLNSGSIANVGGITLGSGTGGSVGIVSSDNSLVGSTAFDRVGNSGAIALTNGNYVFRATEWDNGASVDAGAVKFGTGTSADVGVISAANALVGSTAGDQVGNAGLVALPNGNYVVHSRSWDNGSIADAGAITLGLSNGSVVGAITSEHSVLGVVANEGSSQTFSYDATRNQLAVGQPASNRVVLHRTGIATAISIVSGTPDPSSVGEPVTFTATTTAAPNAPTDGKVTFTASSGATCVDTTPTATSATTAEWSCTLTFTANGVSTVIAEYTGSIIHAYSGSAPETHTTIVEPPLFANGFEGP